MGAITVSNLGKAYKQYPHRWSRLAEWLVPGSKPKHHLKWVLQDVSFSVKTGEAVGIIGVNGAGKSTLLKMITGTVKPTTGSIQVSGRVAALLELGMGFHPDFTGRQNAYMSGQLLGLATEEIATLMPEIEAFADIGDYIDQPVRVYSSGMQVRLAFAIATAHRPDVLIIDEALSVGDAAFQRKCFRRIEDYQSMGTTLLFVSHDVETVKKLCNRALFIKDGRLVQFGAAKQVCDEYEKYLFGNGPSQAKDVVTVITEPDQSSTTFDPALIASCEMTYGNGKADIVSCWLEDTSGRRINVVDTSTPFRWRYRVRFNEDVDNPIFAMMLKTREGVALYGVDSMTMAGAPSKVVAGDQIDVSFTVVNVLASGVYYFNCGVRVSKNGAAEFLSRRIDSAILKVTAGPAATAAIGLVEMNADISISRIVGAKHNE